MKLFFYTGYLLLLAIVLSSCGSEEGNRGQNYSTQKMEVTIQLDTDEILQKNREALPQGNDNQRTGDSIKQENAPVNPDLLQGNDHLGPAGTVAEGVYLGRENIGGISETELAARLQEIASKNDIAVTEAHFDAKTWAIVKEKAGKKLDIDKTKNAVLSASSGERINYSYVNVKPKVTAVQLNGKVKLIAKFTTRLLDRSKSRVKNIRLAAKKLDYKIILPGKEFSFNRTTGSKSKKLGYEDATVIVNTPKGPKHEKAPGGGVCQLSTTVYNAVLKCGLKVTERHEHSDDVHYVAKGKDATVTYNGADLKFVNNRKNPIMLRVYVGKKTVRVDILENGNLNDQ